MSGIADPVGFWGEHAGLIDWFRKPGRVLDDTRAPHYRWFPDATLNACFNALDRHVVRGASDREALIHDAASTGVKHSFTYAELLAEVAAFAGVLRALGVEKGDRVVIHMPMVPEAVIAMLACARLGAVHSVMASGPDPHELAARVDDLSPKVLVTINAVDRALELSEHPPRAVVHKQHGGSEAVEGRDIDWDVAMRAGRTDPAGVVEVAATDPLHIHHTPGHPPGVERDTGRQTVVMAWVMHDIHRVSAGDVWRATTPGGWAADHTFMALAPLIVGATVVLPDSGSVGTMGG